MPDPTREQFDAASRRVAETAPPGLSRDDFYALVDRELEQSSGITTGPNPPDLTGITTGPEQPDRVTTGPNPETSAEMVRRNVGDFAGVLTSPIRGLYSLYQDPKGTLKSMGEGLAENINKSVASDAVEKRGEEPKHSLGTDLGIVASLGATQLPFGRILKTGVGGLRSAAGDVPILGRTGLAGGLRRAWKDSGPKAPEPVPAPKLKEGERIMGPSTMPGGPQGVTKPAPPPAAPAAVVDRYAPNVSGYKAGEILEGGPDIPHGPQVEPYAPNASGYRPGEILDEGAGSIPHPPPKTPAKASSAFDDVLSEELQAEMSKPVVEPRGTTPPESTITTPGREVRPGVEGEFQSTGRPAAPLDPEIPSTLEAAAARREAARSEPTPRRGEPAPPQAEGPAGEPSVLEQQVRDSVIEQSGGDPNILRVLRQLHGSKTGGQIVGESQQTVKTASGDSTSALPEVPRARIDAWLREHPNASPAEIKAYMYAKNSNVLSRTHIIESLKRDGWSDAAIAELNLRNK